MTIRAGVLSDTHLYGLNEDFLAASRQCFSDCTVIIHAGDLVNAAVLEAFAGKTVYAVSGNMCDSSSKRSLQSQLLFEVGGYAIGLAHGAGMGYDIEDRLWNIFPEADCIIYGHTHRAVCHFHGEVLFLNPGSFQVSGPGRHGSSYAILELGDSLQAKLHSYQKQP